MKTEMPDTIYLFPTFFTVGDTIKGDDGLRGCAISNKREIRIDLDAHPEDLKVTMLHEVIHLIMEMGGFREQEERATDVMSMGILSLIRGNPDLIKWLAETRADMRRFEDSNEV